MHVTYGKESGIYPVTSIFSRSSLVREQNCFRKKLLRLEIEDHLLWASDLDQECYRTWCFSRIIQTRSPNPIGPLYETWEVCNDLIAIEA